MLKLFVALQSRYMDVRYREEGQTFAEYGLILALVGIALIVALGLFATSLNGVFTKITNAL